MRDGEGTPRARAGRLATSSVAEALHARASVKRKIVQRLSNLARSLVASGAIEPPAQSSLDAYVPPRRPRRDR